MLNLSRQLILNKNKFIMVKNMDPFILLARIAARTPILYECKDALINS
jgi:hypothetical protein